MIVSPAGHRLESRANQRFYPKAPGIFPPDFASFPLGRINSASRYYRVRRLRRTQMCELTSHRFVVVQNVFNVAHQLRKPRSGWTTHRSLGRVKASLPRQG